MREKLKKDGHTEHFRMGFHSVASRESMEFIKEMMTVDMLALAQLIGHKPCGKRSARPARDEACLNSTGKLKAVLKPGDSLDNLDQI